MGSAIYVVVLIVSIKSKVLLIKHFKKGHVEEVQTIKWIIYFRIAMSSSEHFILFFPLLLGCATVILGSWKLMRIP